MCSPRFPPEVYTSCIVVLKVLLSAMLSEAVTLMVGPCVTSRHIQCMAVIYVCVFSFENGF